ncbi:MAG: hypothetical protein RL754_1183 [Bacteroidota bacterium]|jgi:hypothetical protein
MDFMEFRKFGHDVKNHLTGATLQVQVMKMLLGDEHKDRLETIMSELEKAGDMITDFQHEIKRRQAEAEALESESTDQA